MRLRLNGLRFPAPAQHDLSRRPAGPITVPWTELAPLAVEMDEADGAPAGGRRGLAVDACATPACTGTTPAGLEGWETGVLRLDGLAHLMGAARAPARRR